MKACRACGVAHNPLWRCDDGRIERNQIVTSPAQKVVTRNQSDVTKRNHLADPMVTRNQCPECAAKDAVIASLRAKLGRKDAVRDRAAYMRAYRARSK